jgi:hypothetical protein
MAIGGGMPFAVTAKVFHPTRRFAPQDDPLQLRKIRHARHGDFPPREGVIIVSNTSRCKPGRLIAISAAFIHDPKKASRERKRLEKFPKSIAQYSGR